jgi:dolichol-phosphate mannosyltransferase
MTSSGHFWARNHRSILRIVIVVPTYNEAENLPLLVSALFALPLDLSIFIVDDNSPDGTGKIADSIAADHPRRVRVMHRTSKLGLSTAYLQAFHDLLATDVDAIGQMDADFSHDPKALVDMAKSLENYDMVIGSRYTKGGSTDVRWPLWRKALSAWGNFYARTILGMSPRDVTAGFRLWRRETLLGMPLNRVRSTGYIFTVEMTYLAYCLQYRIGEVPVYFAERRLGKSKMSFKIQVEAALRVWQVLWNYRDLNRIGVKGRLNQD